MNTFPQHLEQQRLLKETMDKIRERNAMRRAEIAIETARGKCYLMGWPVLTEKMGKPAAQFAGKK